MYGSPLNPGFSKATHLQKHNIIRVNKDSKCWTPEQFQKKNHSQYIHSTYDINRLCFVVVANILHVDNCAYQVHSQPQVPKVLLSEEPHTRTQQVLESTTAERSLVNSKFPHREIV